MVYHAFENKLRPPHELWVACAAFLMSAWSLLHPSLLNWQTKGIFGSACLLLATKQLWEGIALLHYQRRLLQLKPSYQTATSMPCLTNQLYLGEGFQWLAIHAQRLHHLMQPETQRYRQAKHLSRCDGQPWLHGVGDESSIFLAGNQRASHLLILGRTRVGKSRLLATLVNQDIRQGKAVLVLDPKGDLSVLQDMFEACEAANRLQDFNIVHAGFPDLSAKYNPLQHYSHISEVATRVVSALPADGESRVFRDVAISTTSSRCIKYDARNTHVPRFSALHEIPPTLVNPLC